LVAHLSLLKVTVPMNVLIFSKSLLSISVLDVKEFVMIFLKSISFLDVSEYTGGNMINLTAAPKEEGAVIHDVKTEMSQYAFHEMEYYEALDFYSNLRSMKFFLALVAVGWIASAALFLLVGCCKYDMWMENRKWPCQALFVRVWNYMGLNALIRIFILQYVLVLFAGYVVFRK